MSTNKLSEQFIVYVKIALLSINFVLETDKGVTNNNITYNSCQIVHISLLRYTGCNKISTNKLSEGFIVCVKIECYNIDIKEHTFLLMMYRGWPSIKLPLIASKLSISCIYDIQSANLRILHFCE